MPSVFETAWLARHGALDACFGEPCTILGLAAPVRPDGRADHNARPVPDAARPRVAFTGIFDNLAADRLPEARSHASADSHMISSSLPRVGFATIAIPYRPRQGDIVIRLGTSTAYSVSDLDEGTPGRTTLKLTAARPAAPGEI